MFTHKLTLNISMNTFDLSYHGIPWKPKTPDPVNTEMMDREMLGGLQSTLTVGYVLIILLNLSQSFLNQSLFYFPAGKKILYTRQTNRSGLPRSEGFSRMQDFQCYTWTSPRKIGTAGYPAVH